MCLKLPAHPTPSRRFSRWPQARPIAIASKRRPPTARVATTACSIDLGFAFEGFDGLGRQRELDNGVPVDTTGSFPFESGRRQFADARELMRILAEEAQAHTCYAKMLAGYALQRDVVEKDRPLLGDLATVSRERSLKEMVISLVRNPAFRLRAEGMP